MTERLEEKLNVVKIILRNLGDGPMRWTPLRKATLGDSGTPSTFRNVLDWLLRCGYIDRPEQGLYAMTERDRMFLRVLEATADPVEADANPSGVGMVIF